MAPMFLFRSEPMSYVRLVMFEEAASETIRALGRDFGKLHIVDKGQIDGAHYKKHKVKTVAIAAWEKKLSVLKDIMAQEKVAAPGPEVEASAFFSPDGELLEALQLFLDPVEEDLQIHVNFKRQQTQMINEQIERIEVLRMCRALALQDADRAAMLDDDDEHRAGSYGSFESDEGRHGPHSMSIPLLSDDGEQRDVSFSETLSGALSSAKQVLFERMIFRVSRGNAIINFREVEQPVVDPASGEPVSKTVFSIIAIRSAEMQRRIKKICAYFGANLYSVPRTQAEFERELAASHQKLQDHRIVLGRTSDRITEVLERVAWAPDGSSPLVNWTAAVRQEMAVEEALKRTFVLQGEQGGIGASASASQQTVVVAHGWVPTGELSALRGAVSGVNKSLKSQQVVVSEQDNPGAPPTYFPSNDFVGPFQQIVDTYGMARYQEVNPGLFTIVTFPFLYGVMYGDMLHGSLLLIFALYLVLNEKSFKAAKKFGTMGMLGDVFDARYVILLMSLFAVYMGLCYNDFASIPIDFFGSRWNTAVTPAVPKADVGFPYPFGVDPEWLGKKNELVFMNSLKMKMAVILGVVHMSFGVCLGLFNHLHFKNYAGVVFEFIPRITFLLCTFGYMDFLIIFKWCTDWSVRKDISPPNLIQTMINMFLKPGSVDKSVQLYTGQATIQLALLLTALVCVPLMLFGEPCFANLKFKRMYGHLKRDDGDEDEEGGLVPHEEEHEDEGGHGHGAVGPNYSFGDHLINQAIHTIEFVLGAVSNTASYLRLWALSLAHAQLAQVFWDKMMMEYGVNTGSFFFTFVGFAGWAACTFAVLLCMDVVECFLHALRLHWVEFQNKFYYADGYKFKPFSFDALEEEN